MREQEARVEAGRRGGVIRSLLGVARLPEDGHVGAEEGGSKKEDGGAERKAVVRVVAADMPPALQRRAFRCARDELAGMPHFPRRLEPKRLALALKKMECIESAAPALCSCLPLRPETGLLFCLSSVAVGASGSQHLGDGVRPNETIIRVANHRLEQLINRTVQSCNHVAVTVTTQEGISKFDQNICGDQTVLGTEYSHLEFDTAYGAAWHCVVGTGFGSYVTHARGGFLYFSVDKVYILLFRTAVEPPPH